MRVLINCLSSRSGGAIAYLRNLLPLLAEELAERRSQLLTLARSDQDNLLPASVIGPSRLIVESASVNGWKRFVWERAQLGNISRTARAEVVFTPYQVGTHVAGVPNVSMLRNMEPFFAANYPYTPKSRARNLVIAFQTGRFLRRSDAIVAVSDYAAHYARTALDIDPRRIARIYHGRDPMFSSGDPGTDKATLSALGVRQPFVFSCGSLLPYRRLEDVIGAFEKFAASRADVPALVIAGSGTDSRYRERLLSLIASSHIAHQITYVGQVRPEAMVALYRQSKVFVTSTEIEACPNIALESMSAGCRIVSADIPVLREIHGSAATFYPARNVTALSQEIEAAWTEESASADLRRAARTRGEAFSWRVCAQQTADLLLRIGATSRPPL